jgi:hypothetical protein
MKSTTRSRAIPQASFIFAVAVALAVAACTGGAGLDLAMGPVDHGCHNAEGADIGGDMGGDGSGCDTR